MGALRPRLNRLEPAARRLAHQMVPWSYLLIVGIAAMVLILSIATTAGEKGLESEQLALRAAFAGQAYTVYAHVDYDDCALRGEYAPKSRDQGVGCFVAGKGALFDNLAGVPEQEGGVWLSRPGSEDVADQPDDGIVGGRRVAIAPLPRDGSLPRELDPDSVRVSAIWAANRPDHLVSRDVLFVVDESIFANEGDLEERTEDLGRMLPGWDIDTISEAAAKPVNLDDYEVVVVDFRVGPGALDDALITTKRGVVSWSFDQWTDWGVVSVPINADPDSPVVILATQPKAELVNGLFGNLPSAAVERMAVARRWLVLSWMFLLVSSFLAVIALERFTRLSDQFEVQAEAQANGGDSPTVRDVLSPTLFDDLAFETNRYRLWNKAFLACSGIVAALATLVVLGTVPVTGNEPSYATWSSWLGGLAWVTVGMFLALVGRLFFGARHLQRFEEVFSPGNEVRPEDWPQIQHAGASDIGVCFSGGGVRSAAYALGAIQVLQERKTVWGKVKHVAAVSGGSYMAAAYAIARQEGSDYPYRVGSQEERHLRNNTNYLAPTLIDKLRAFSEWFSGFAVNILGIAAVLWLAAGLAAVVAKSAAVFPQLALLSVPGGHDLVAWHVWELSGDEAVLLSLGAVVAVGIFSATRLNGPARRISRRVAELFAWVAMSLAILLILVPGASRLWEKALELADSVPALSATVGSIAVVGWIVATARTLLSQHPGKVAALVAGLAPPLLALAFMTWSGWQQVRLTLTEFWIGLGIAFATTVAMGLILPTMRVSLHPFYRRRLSYAYAWVGDEDDNDQEADKSNEDVAGTGAAQIAGVEDLRLDRLNRTPKIIISAAANYGPSPVTPPGRSALPFILGAESVGLETDGSGMPSKPAPWLVGTEDVSALYQEENKTALRVMDAVAISGAAVSPSMGKRTVGLYRALLAILNIRLGVWMPNPLLRHLWAAQPGGKAPDSRKDFDRAPRQFPWFAKEVLGQHEPMQHFVYVTDGGHYDNLGLVTLLRKRYKTIICFDAGGEDMDSFSSIGQAMMLAESELGVQIEFSPNPQLWPPVEKDSTQPAEKKAWFGKGDALPEVPSDHKAAVIKYPGSEPNGRLIYCKTAVTVNTAWSVKDYRIRHPSFPNISTIRQLYDDERFEAYRELGAEAAVGAVSTLENPEPAPTEHRWIHQAQKLGLKALDSIKNWLETS